MTKKIMALILALLMLFSLSACGDSPEDPEVTESPSGEPVSDPEMIIQTKLAYSSIDSLSPFTVESAVNSRLMALLYDGLFTVDASYTASPALAQGCAGAAQTLNITLDISKKFSDGSAVSADDVIYSFEKAKESPVYAQRLRNFVSVTSSNSSNLIFTLEHPDVYAVNCLTFPVVKKGSDEDTPIGSGRYKLVKSGSRLLLLQNVYHDHFTPSITCIELTEIKNSSVTSSSLEIGNTCFSFNDLSSGSYSRVNAVTVDVLMNNLVFLSVNTENEALAVPEVRQAISAAINRAEIATSAYQGHAKPAVTPFNPDWSEVSSVSSEVNADPAALLAAEGVNVKSKTFSLLVNSDNKFKTETAHLIASALTAAGMETVVNEMNTESFAYAAKRGNFDFCINEVRLTANMDLTDLFMGGECAPGLTYAAQAKSFERYEQLRNGDCEIMDFINAFSAELPFIPLFYRYASACYTNSLDLCKTTCNDNDVFSNIESWKLTKAD